MLISLFLLKKPYGLETYLQISDLNRQGLQSYMKIINGQLVEISRDPKFHNRTKHIDVSFHILWRKGQLRYYFCEIL